MLGRGSSLAAAARQSIRIKKKDTGAGAASVAATDLGLPGAAAAAKKSWEVDRAVLSNMTELGEGNFGKVYKATATGLLGPGPVVVAVKTLASQAPDAAHEFLQEAGIMQALDGPHHIVRLLGVCTREQPYYMIMELLPRGDLKTVLRLGRPTGARPSPLSLAHFGRMAADICEGMAYLASAHIVHRDLAARNCLVAEDYTVKVGDFGLTRKTYERDYYRMHGAGALPVRWLAPECLEDGVFSTGSDVWAFGITLWEIVTMGRLPYGDLSNQEVFEAVCEDDFRLPMPRGCPPALFIVMSGCWARNPKMRGTFDEKLRALIPSLAVLPTEPVSAALFAPPPAAASRGDEHAYDSLTARDPACDRDSGPEEDGGGVDAHGYDALTKDSPYTPYDPGFKPVPLPPAPYYAAPADQPAGTKKETYYDVKAAVPAAITTAVVEAYSDSHAKTQQDHESEIIKWLVSVAGVPQPSGSLHNVLKSGVLLCQVMNKLQPSAVAKIHDSKLAFKQMENIAHFLTACQAYGVPQSDVFVTVDLFEETNMKQVLMCLRTLRAVAANKKV